MKTLGSSVLVLTNTNTLSGTTTISAGSLVLATSSALENSIVSVGVTNGLLFSTSGQTYTMAPCPAAAASCTASGSTNPITLSVGGNTTPTIYSGGLSGSGDSRSPAAACN